MRSCLENQPIPFACPTLGSDEIEAVGRALRDGQVASGGAICERVRERLAQLTGARLVLLTARLSGALELAFGALSLEPGDEVLLPTLARAELAAAVMARGARPIFCDVERDTLTLDVADAPRHISRRTKLLVAVHENGVACNLEALAELARSRGVGLCEDASQGLGATWMGRHLGTVAPLGWLSFEEGMSISSGGGGALLAADPALLAESSQGTPWELGPAARGLGAWHAPGDLVAALLEAQLVRIPELARARQRTWRIYDEALAELDVLRGGPLWLPRIPGYATHNAQSYTLQLRNRAQRDRLRKDLAEEGVETGAPHAPLHLSRFARKLLGPQPSLPEAEQVAECALRLPTFAGLTRPQAERVALAVRRSVASALWTTRPRSA